jgi:AMMECR1 domain-containing protein/orotate phosphoribosyltransferase
MWWAPWLDDLYKPQLEHVLVVVCPNGYLWVIDSEAANCTSPAKRNPDGSYGREQENHHCWIIHGAPPQITVDKNGETCAAGAGSILVGGYHGFLRNGAFTTKGPVEGNPDLKSPAPIVLRRSDVPAARSSESDARAALLALLRRKGLLQARPGEPVVDRSGRSAPWMFYSWNLSLTTEGSALAARCLLDRLKGFHATQLATYGTTGIPLLTSCILLGEGKYTGICVRETPKGNANGRQIEGPADRSRPVVIIDDSLSSGTSLLKGIRVLEGHGFQVEGTICLVHFPDRGGRERGEALGYRVETLFDIWEDLQVRRPVHIPGFQRVGEFVHSVAPVEDGLSPAQVARRVAEQLLREGNLPAPPRRFDAKLHAPGGVWVSFRDRRTNVRLARSGFWHFDPNDANACRDVVLATAKTVRTGGLRLEQLDNLKIAVTFFGRLEAIQPSGLDFSRYGIVVRSKVWPVKVGGALPNTQVFTSEREQLDLAIRNAQVGPFEPYELYRHTLSKYVEPGEEWLPYGTADGPENLWTVDRAIGEALTRRARQTAVAAVCGLQVPPGALDAKLIPTRVAAVAATLYNRGVIGCSVSSRENLDDAIVAAATAAARDKRFRVLTPDLTEKICPAVSVLYDPEWIGNSARDKAARKLRLGRDSLAVQQAEHRAVFLESVGPHFDWSKEKLTQRLLSKAGATDGTANWTTYRTATWLLTSDGAVPHVFGFAAPPDGPCDSPALRGDLALLGRYVDANLLPSGLPRYAQTPVPGWKWDHGSVARAVHGLMGLVIAGRLLRRPDWRRHGEEGIRRCLDAVEIPEHATAGRLRLVGKTCEPMADCLLLTAATRAGCGGKHCRQMNALAARVASMFREDGSIHPDGQPIRMDRDNDYLPNAAILALAVHYGNAPAGLAARMEPYRAWQLRRFRLLHRWGQAGWLPQACAAVYFATGDPVYASTAFEVADWCLDRQIEATGAFLTDLAPGGPTFHTAFIAEAIADTWALALALNERERAQRYQRSWYSTMRFARQLIIRPVDAPCLADPDRSIGGVRGSLTSSTVRIDFVSHLIVAMAKGLPLPERAPRRK